MKRYRYGLNCQHHNAMRIGDMMPMGYFEVVPGDTISGKVDLHYITDTTSSFVMNRAYYDLYAFYVPYRLLWDGFPEWLINGTGTLPVVTDVMEINFEKRLTSGATHSTNNVAWLRYCYNYVHNTFFNRSGFPDAALDSAAMQNNWFRPSTFFESEVESEAANLASETIDTSGPTTTVDDIRAAFNADAFKKTRAYYGDKYTDYLASVGVQANWSILDEPELIGKTLGQMKYQTTTATAIDTVSNVDVGDPAGQWSGNLTMQVKRTFCPEHGLIAFYGSPMIDQISRRSQPPMLAHENPEDYWSPERDGTQPKQYTSKLWSSLGHADVTLPQWEHLRKGYNLTAQDNPTADLDNYLLMPDVNVIASYKNFYTIANVFQGNIGAIPGSGVTPAEIIATADYKLIKRSPVGTRTGAPLR